jgi:tetratricopeptide (TPR) repeat protein
VARAIGDHDRELEGRLLLVKVLMTTGDLSGVYRELDACERLAARQQQPSQQWYVEVDRATLMLFEGRFDQAEEAILRVLRLGERAQGMDAQVAYRLQMFLLRKEQGRLEEMEETIRRSIAEYPWYPLFRCVLANLYAELEREADARRRFAELADGHFRDMPLDNEWLFAMCFLPEVASFLGDRAAAATLYGLLVPYADRNAFSPPELCIGPVSHYLGILAATMGRWPEAERHFLHAAEMGDRMGARPWSARARLDHARMLLRRDDPGDRGAARDLLLATLAAGREMGMVALERRAEELLRGADRAAEELAVEPVPGQPATFRLEGDYWTVAYGGRAIRLRDTKGLRYIHRLLSEPSRELHVLDLASDAAPTPARREPGLAQDSGHAGPVLDPQATAAYRRRADELREEIEEAEQWADAERVARGREELEFIEAELASAYGLGRRPRKAADSTERVRKAVTNRIRDSLDRIRRQHPELGRHLANAISTGTFCSYAPDRTFPWEL